MDKFEQMVETIEEAEDMVECKECFDLFPKAECTKMDHGAILKEDLFWSHIFCCCFILTTVNLRYFCDIEMEI